MNGQRVFVTGGAGVIGMELIPKLAAKGADILVGDLKPRPASFPKEVEYLQGDLNTLSQSTLERFAPEIIIHLAATFERTTETQGFWNENYRHNVALSHHVMTLAQNCQSLRRVVFASSYLIFDPALYQFDAPRDSAVYLEETDPIRPRNLTGMAKLSHEMELQFLSGFETCSYSTLAVRIFRGYGCNSRDVISRWVRALLEGKPITVYRPEGIFDYLYAADSAEGLLRLSASDRATGIVNLGTGRGRRVKEIVDVLREHFPEAQIQTAAADIPFEASAGNISRLKELIDWVPEHDLEDAIPKIISYERQRSAALQEKRSSLQNVLVTSASRKTPLVSAVRDALTAIDLDAQVVAGDIDPQTLSQYVADDFWLMPKLDTLDVGLLIEHCQSRDIGAVLPTRDGELLFWATNRAAFAQADIAVLVSSAEAVQRCLDKLMFAQFGLDTGLPIIPASETIEDIGDGPLVVKERFGAGSRGLGLNLEIGEARSHALKLDKPIFQPFVAGPEISIDGWIDADGCVLGVVLRRRDQVVNGESQVTTTFRDPGVEEQARTILGSLNLRGAVVMQAVLSPSKGLQIIEVNARFGGASTCSIAAGLQSIAWSLQEALRPDLPRPIFMRSSQEVRQIRVPSDLLVHDPDL